MMNRKLLWSAVALWILLTAGLIFWSSMTASAASAPAKPLSTEAFSDLLREALRKNPDLVLDILREHSEVVLDIAQQGSNQRRRKGLVTQWKKDAEVHKNVDLANRPVRGAADAPVTIVAFSDFMCPYCERAAGTIQKLLKDYDGKVRYVFKHFPLEERGPARTSAEYHVAAAMQDPEKSWILYDLLFSRREEILKEGEPAIKRAAQEAGLDMKRLAADLRSKAVKDAIDADMIEAVNLGVQGTPYFLVNDLVVRGALAPDLFAEAVNMALDNAPRKK